MSDKELQNMWYYFLDIEKELADSSRYIEPDGQEKVYSFEFRKIIILACTECETAFKAMCEAIDDTQKRGSMEAYKRIILGKYLKIVDTEVHISRWHKTIKPFAGWDSGKLQWWNAYQLIKHDRGLNLIKATYENAVFSLSALYILIMYLSNTLGISLIQYHSNYIDSEYTPPRIYCKPNKKLPDF